MEEGRDWDDGSDSHIEDNLVQELEGVTQKHQWHNVPVDPAAQGIDVDGINGSGVAVAVKVLPGGVDLTRGAVCHLGLGGDDVVLFRIGPVVAILVRHVQHGGGGTGWVRKGEGKKIS
jgi:hypothetical protein